MNYGAMKKMHNKMSKMTGKKMPRLKIAQKKWAMSHVDQTYTKNQ